MEVLDGQPLPICCGSCGSYVRLRVLFFYEVVQLG